MPWVDDSCKTCGDCLDVCPVNAIGLENGKAAIDERKCTRCGDCFDACPIGAIRPDSENPELRGKRNKPGRGAGKGRGRGQGAGNNGRSSGGIGQERGR